MGVTGCTCFQVINRLVLFKGVTVRSTGSCGASSANNQRQYVKTYKNNTEACSQEKEGKIEKLMKK